ncbi:20918_t:CDS:2, partial [Gigaspora rosea]
MLPTINESRYEVLESFVLYLWNKLEFDSFDLYYKDFLSSHYPSPPKHLPFSLEFFDINGSIPKISSGCDDLSYDSDFKDNSPFIPSQHSR